MNLIDRDGSRDERETAESVVARIAGLSKAKPPKADKKRSKPKSVWLNGKVVGEGRGRLCR